MNWQALADRALEGKLITRDEARAVLAAPEKFRGMRVGLVLTGGNVDLDKLPWQ
mgnify:CR=1 FL=1